MELENIFDPDSSRNFRREVTLKKFQSAAEVIRKSLPQQKLVEEVEDSEIQQPAESEPQNQNSPPNPAEFRKMILGCY